MAQPPLVLDPLASPPVPPGLFNVASGPLDLPDHGFTSGAVWNPDTCGLANLYPTACLSPPYTAFALGAAEPLAQAWPMAVYSSIVTGTAGYDREEAVRRVHQRLINTEQTLVEKGFWGGTATLFTNQQNFFGTTPGTGGGGGSTGVAGGVLQQLANVGAGTSFFDLGTATSVLDGTAQLEQSAADHYYGTAILHARPRLAAYIAGGHLFRDVGLLPTPEKTNMFTPNLNLWSLGNGYTGVGPTGQAPDATTEYMWATGRVVVWRSPEVVVSEPDQLIDKTSNQRGLYAFRNYMVGVECWVACVKVTRA